mmetsp:Transcript_19951/g.44008  ORF Transcript_19951/g.44008 Transcript_19951/m.44008 type:complete len:349 (-) Transcript_19951:8-1054(-)
MGCSLLLILPLYHSQMAHLDKYLSRHPHCAFQTEVVPLYGVLVLFIAGAGFGFGLLSAQNLFGRHCTSLLLLIRTFAQNSSLIEPVLSLFHFDFLSPMIQRFAVFPTSKAPQQVLGWRLVQVLFYMMKCMLRNVGNANIWMLPNNRFASDRQLADQGLDHGGLASTVGTYHRHAAQKRHLDTHIVESRRLVAGICVGDILHLQELLSLGLHALQHAWLWQNKALFFAGEAEIGLRLWTSAHKIRDISLVGLQLSLLDIDDMATDFVQEGAVMGDHNGRDWSGCILAQAEQVIAQPAHICNIQVSCWFIQQKDVCTHEHGSHQPELHFPSSGEMADLALQLLIVKANAP